MKIGYKERPLCSMCKERFILEKKEWKEKHWPRNYCPTCCKKYFNKKIKD